MTPSEVIAEVRQLAQDTRATYRYSDEVLLGFVNQTLKRMAIIRPDLFTVIETIPTTFNTVVQTLPSSAIRLVQIYAVSGGNVVTEVSRETLDSTVPGWMSEAAGTPVNYVRHVRNPCTYFLYPRPTDDLLLLGEYAKQPPTYDLSDSIALQDAYFPAVVDGTVFLVESVDNEHVNSGRAKLFQESFTQALGVSLQSRIVTDTKGSGFNKGEVI